MKLISCVFIPLVAIGLFQSNVWRGIEPLRSTRADVERVLGPPTPDSKAQYGAEYMTENERVIVSYSTGTCSVEHGDGWHAPVGMVIWLSVYPKIKPKIAALNLDRNKYEERQDPELSEIIYYTSEEDGVSIETREGLVTAFRYWPTAKENNLKCPEPIKPSHH